MKKFSVVVEVSIEETKYDEIKTWEVEPSDHVTTLLTEPLREKGMVVKAYADLEEEIISRSCIGGVCDD